MFLFSINVLNYVWNLNANRNRNKNEAYMSYLYILLNLIFNHE